jgi:hypothetical protein
MPCATAAPELRTAVRGAVSIAAVWAFSLRGLRRLYLICYMLYATTRQQRAAALREVCVYSAYGDQTL